MEPDPQDYSCDHLIVCDECAGIAVREQEKAARLRRIESAVIALRRNDWIYTTAIVESLERELGREFSRLKAQKESDHG